MSDRSRSRRVDVLPLVGLAGALVLWAVVIAVLVEPGDLLRRFAPADALGSVGNFFAESRGPTHVVATLRRLAVGLVTALVGGVGLGIAVGMSDRLSRATSAVFQFLRMVSPLAWTPIAIIVLGVGDTPVYFLVAVAAIWPVLLNTVAGIHALDPGWIDVGHSLGATRAEIIRTIIAPGILPHIVTGLRVALGVAWVVIVPAEMLGVDSGLGYAILDARDRLAYSELMAIILVIGVIGYVLDRVAVRLTRTGRPVPPRGSLTPTVVGSVR